MFLCSTLYTEAYYVVILTDVRVFMYEYMYNVSYCYMMYSYVYSSVCCIDTVYNYRLYTVHLYSVDNS